MNFANSILKTYCRRVTFNSLRKMSESKLSTSEKIASMSPTELVKNNVKVSDWNKKLLVFSGKFKSASDIPEYLPFETVDRARNLVRIKVANIMIVMTVIGSLVMVYTGKKKAERGESVAKMNLDWHREYNRQAEEAAKREAAAAANK